MHTAIQLRTLVQREGNWEGTVSNLAATLDDSNEAASKRAPHLAIWLRRHEPMLFWHYGVHVRFSRTGRRRLVHLACREVAAPDGLVTAIIPTPPSPEIGDGKTGGVC